MKQIAPESMFAAIALSTLLLLTGCSGNTGLRVDVLYDDTVDFDAFTTYRWETGPRDDSPNAASVDERIKSTAEEALTASGLRPAAADEAADLLLTYYGGIEDNLLMEGVRWEVAPGVVWTGASPLAETRSYRVGTLILDFADAGTETVVWSGVVTGKAPDGGQLRERVEKAVRKALARFPPR